MSITKNAVTAGVQSAASTAKGQATDHYEKEINSSPVSEVTKKALHIGMQGAAAAAAVAMTETILKAFENIQKSKSDKTKSDTPKTKNKSYFETLLKPIIVGLALGAAVPFAAAALEK